MSTNVKQAPLILTVDDSTAARKQFVRLLTRFGYRVIEASDAIEGLSLARRERPDCIITDYEMPKVNGPEFCQRIKSSPNLKGIPVIMLTSKEDVKAILKGVSAGADDYLTKGLNPEVINVKIQSMLRMKSLNDQVVGMKRLEGIRSVIAMYNHEFNNPLTIIFGKLKMLRKQEELSEKGLKHLDSVDKALARVQELIQAISKLDQFDDTDYAKDSKMLNIKKAG